jgi:exosome complex component RRP42
MAPYTPIPLSPAELSYLYQSLTQTPPIRPDGRTPMQFRPLIAETDVLPTANGSARICFADGTEAVVGVKAEVEKSWTLRGAGGEVGSEGVLGLDTGGGGAEDVDMDDEDGDVEGSGRKTGKGRDEWLEIAIEIPGLRDDDALPTFLSAMLSEALLSTSGSGSSLKDRLYINSRFHWRLYIDILLLSPPLSYPLPLLSLTTHLALLTTRLPALISEKDEDPLFNDDWEASKFLYPRSEKKGSTDGPKPPITLLVASIGSTILFDPSRDELAVADAVVAISVAQSSSGLSVVALRTIDPPSRLTAAGVPKVLNTTTGATGAQSLSAAEVLVIKEKDLGQSVWRPPRGGVSRGVVARMVKMCVEKGGVGEGVLGSLGGVES